MDAIDNNDELRDAPTLRSIPKVDPFVVPDGFFDRFPQQMQQRIAAEHVRGTRWSWGLPIWAVKPAFGALTLFAVIILAWTLWPTKDTAVDSAQLATYETLDHVTDDLEADDIYAALSTDDPLLAEADLGLTGDELAEYIEREELPLDLLMEEL